jgi:hypothetical protein
VTLAGVIDSPGAQDGAHVLEAALAMLGPASEKPHIRRGQVTGYTRTPNETSLATAVGDVRHCSALLPRRWLQW